MQWCDPPLNRLASPLIGGQALLSVACLLNGSFLVSVSFAVPQRDLLKFTPVFTTKQLLAMEMLILKVTRMLPQRRKEG